MLRTGLELLISQTQRRYKGRMKILDRIFVMASRNSHLSTVYGFVCKTVRWPSLSLNNMTIYYIELGV